MSESGKSGISEYLIVSPTRIKKGTLEDFDRTKKNRVRYIGA